MHFQPAVKVTIFSLLLAAVLTTYVCGLLTFFFSCFLPPGLSLGLDTALWSRLYLSPESATQLQPRNATMTLQHSTTNQIRQNAKRLHQRLQRVALFRQSVLFMMRCNDADQSLGPRPFDSRIQGIHRSSERILHQVHKTYRYQILPRLLHAPTVWFLP